VRLRRNDNIVIYFEDYPSNVYPWMALADRGVQVRLVSTRELGVIRPVDVLRQIDEQTRLVALASCHFIAGARLDHAALGKLLHERDILFCVDGIQSVGAFPTTVEHIDFLAADAHKWLLGPCAAGLMYVRRSLQETLRPTTYGWHNIRCPDFVAQEQMKFRPDAGRFEAGSHNLLGIAGLKAAIELLLEIGIDNIAAELLRKRARLVPALQAKGFHVAAADLPAELASGIISASHPEKDIPALHRKLEAENITTSLRTDRSARHYLRISPHFYNTDAELDQLLERL
jgi:selenocysteine lyase/cysteine desulfurase